MKERDPSINERPLASRGRDLSSECSRDQPDINSSLNFDLSVNFDSELNEDKLYAEFGPGFNKENSRDSIRANPQSDHEKESSESQSGVIQELDKPIWKSNNSLL